MFKFLHAADIHLDSPLAGLERFDDAPVDEIRTAPRLAFSNLVDYAINEGIDFVIIAGDLYDGDWPDFRTGLFFNKQMSRLNKAGIQVFIVAGNHDAASTITKNLTFPKNVKSFSHKKPETFLLEDIKVAFHGQSYKTKALTDNLAAGYPLVKSGYFNIGLLHTALIGRKGHDTYAPCTVSELQSKGYDYWALGHVHNREEVETDPFILFPGNLQGRNIRETGPKGATLVTVDNGSIESAEHIDFDTVRWYSLNIDISGAENGYAAVDIVRNELLDLSGTTDGRICAVRIIMTGMTAAHEELVLDEERWRNEIRVVGFDVDESIWIEKIQIRTKTRKDLSAILDSDDPFADILKSIQEYIQADKDDLERFTELFQGLKMKLPPEYFDQEESINFSDPEALRPVFEKLEQFLVPKILGAAS
ncbi:exonuclease SbcCD subunit D [Thermodesulfobacteriota bacterium]